MENLYLKCMPFTEIVETCDKFHYDSIAPCKIENLCIKDTNDKHIKLSTDNLMNLSKYNNNDCHVSNKLYIKIPSIYALEHEKKTGIGKGGSKFIVTFIGGNPNNAIVCGRYE